MYPGLVPPSSIPDEIDYLKKEAKKAIDTECTKLDFCRAAPNYYHTWINVGFISLKLVCKYCDLDKNKYDRRKKEIEDMKKLYE